MWYATFIYLKCAWQKYNTSISLHDSIVFMPFSTKTLKNPRPFAGNRKTMLTLIEKYTCQFHSNFQVNPANRTDAIWFLNIPVHVKSNYEVSAWKVYCLQKVYDFILKSNFMIISHPRMIQYKDSQTEKWSETCRPVMSRSKFSTLCSIFP